MQGKKEICSNKNVKNNFDQFELSVVHIGWVNNIQENIFSIKIVK